MKPDFKFWFAPEVFSASAFDLPIISIVSVRAAWTLAVAKNKVYKKVFQLVMLKIPCIPRTKCMSALGTT